MSDSDNDCYGPALPPHLLKRKNSEDSPVRKKSESDSGKEDYFHRPALLPHPTKQTKTDKVSEDIANYGPALPPSASKTEPSSSSRLRDQPLGPTLPPGFQRDEPDNDTSSDEDDFVGPLPPNKVTAASLALEERALELKIGKLTESKEDSAEHREEWMLVPPQVMVQAGVTAKSKFSSTKCERDRDQSGWTETPEEKRRKAAGLVDKVEQKRNLQAEAELISVKKRDKEQEEIVKRHKKSHKRDKSLLDMHSEKRKKEKKSTHADQTRRPFNRETDLQLSKLNPRQIKSVVDQAKILDSRFSAGSNKFL